MKTEERIHWILAEALKLPTLAERESFLRGACGGDAALRQRVEERLRQGQKESPRPAAEPPGEEATVVTPPSHASPQVSAEEPGSTIGRYKLLEKVGEGGFGAVYVAEQREPVKRRVALKIIKLGMDTRQVVARFEAERQALAMMDHPNIAKVLDAGATETGRPFFVMELVKGIPMTQYCDREKLGMRERLELFIPVCHAIQHAHQKGIIHRDIKPSNILVTLHDGVPVPKVIDFGIAKATQQELTDKTVYTQFQQFIGTPAYMSPEQAEMSGLDIDTRSDIYSLGVLLYELLTGTTPFDSKELLASGLDAMRKIIREREPVQPSTRLRQTATRHFSTTSRAAAQTALASDLDWIVMKCLEKDRTRRYETANGLATDVLRHLRDEPVTARPPGKAYRLKKLVRRNKLTFAAAAAFTGALMLGLGLSTWLFFRERAARRQAIAAQRVQSELRKEAEAEARKSEQVAQLLKAMLQEVGPSAARGRDTAMLREILDNTSERVGRGLKDQPEVEAEIRTTLADVYSALGQYSKAEQAHREALALRKSLWGDTHTNVADSLDSLGRVLTFQGRIRDAEPLIMEALHIRTNVLGFEHLNVASSLFQLAQLRFRQAKVQEVESLVRESLRIRRKLLGNNHLAVVESLHGLVNALALAGRVQEAESIAREALAVRSGLPDDERAAADAELSHISFGWLLNAQGKLPEAESALRQELSGDQNRLGPEHPEVARDLYRLATVLERRGKLEEADRTARQAVALSRKTVGEQHFYTAFSLGILRQIRVRSGKVAEAEAVCRQELAIWSVQTLPGNFLHTSVALALLLQQQGKQAEAELVYTEALATARKQENPVVRAEGLGVLATHFREKSQLARAESLYREGLAVSRTASTNDADVGFRLTHGLALVLHAQGKPGEAEAVFRAGLDDGRKWGDPLDLAGALAWYGDLLRTQGRTAEAEAAYREGWEILHKASSATPEQRQWLAAGLAVTLESQHKLAQAEAAYREAVTNSLLIAEAQPVRLRWQLDALIHVLTLEGKEAEAERFSSVLRNLSASAQGDQRAALAADVEVAGRRARLKDVVVASSKLLELNPGESIWHLRKAVALLYSGESDQYRTACKEMLARFEGTTVAGSAEQTAKALLLISREGAELNKACDLAARAVSSGQGDLWYSFLQLTEALAKYRRGKPAEAIVVLQQVVGQPLFVEGTAHTAAKRDAAAYCVLAMAHRQLKHADEARVALAKARELVEQKLPRPGLDDLEHDWENCLIAHILLREATAGAGALPGG